MKKILKQLAVIGAIFLGASSLAVASQTIPWLHDPGVTKLLYPGDQMVVGTEAIGTSYINTASATTSTVTGPCAVTCFTVKNTDPDGGDAAFMSDATPSAQHTVTFGYDTLFGGLVTGWIDNNGNWGLSQGQGRTAINVSPVLTATKLAVKGNCAIGTTYSIIDPVGADDCIIEGKLGVGVNNPEDQTAQFQTTSGSFTGDLNALSTFNVANGTGSLGQLLSINSSGFPVWVSTSTLGFSSVPAYYTQSPSSKFLGGMFDDWMVPGDLNGSGVSLATGAYTANQISAVHVVFPRSGTIVGWKAMTAINGGANSTVLCGLYNSNPYPTTLVGSATAVSTATSAADAMATTSIPFNAGGYDVVGFSSTTPQVRGQGIGGYDKVYGTTQSVLAWNTSISSTTAPLTGNLPANFPIAGAVRANGVAPGSGCLMQVVYN